MPLTDFGLSRFDPSDVIAIEKSPSSAAGFYDLFVVLENGAKLFVKPMLNDQEIEQFADEIFGAE